MVASSRVLDALRTIGLNKYERNLWVGLLSRGASTAGELSDISNVPRSRCYDVLESLAERGFVIIQPGKPMKYVAVNPSEAMERLKKKVTEEAADMNTRIERLAKSETIKDLEKIHKESIKTIKPEDMTGALKGRYAMHQQLEGMLKKAKKSVKIMTTDSGLKELEENHFNLLKKINSAGVKVQIIAHISKESSEAAKNLSKFAQVKDISDVETLESASGRLFIVDGSEFILGLTDDQKTHPTQDVAFWTQGSHAAVNFFEPMFEMAWKNAKAVK